MSPMRMVWIAVFLAVLVWSGIAPKDFTTWCLEVFPAVAGAVVLWFTRERFPMTTLIYVLILIHCVILMVGGHYTYAEVPLFDTIAEVFGHERNNYDKVGHLAQGFIPAIVAREVLIRKKVVNGAAWTDLFAFCICLAFSAFYELIEWGVALASGQDAEAFLGSQGYEWDTQSDMGYAALGALIALITLSRFHDRQLERLKHSK